MSPLRRSVAVRLVDTLGDDALPAWREAASARCVGPHARAVLADWDQGPEPGDADWGWFGVEAAAAALEDKGPDEACSPRLERSLAAAVLEAGLEEIDEGDAISTIDRFTLQYRLPDGQTVVDRFVASRPDLEAADREMLLSWRDPVEGIFEIRGQDGDAIILLNLLDDMEYRTYSNMEAAHREVYGRALGGQEVRARIRHALGGRLDASVRVYGYWAGLIVTVREPQAFGGRRYVVSRGVRHAEKPGFRYRRSWRPVGQPGVQRVDQRAGVLPGPGEGPAAGEEQPAAWRPGRQDAQHDRPEVFDVLREQPSSFRARPCEYLLVRLCPQIRPVRYRDHVVPAFA